MMFVDITVDQIIKDLEACKEKLLEEGNKLYNSPDFMIYRDDILAIENKAEGINIAIGKVREHRS